MELGLETLSSLLEENRGGCLDTKLGGVLRAGLAFDHSCGRSPCPSLTVTVKPDSSFLRKRTKTGMK